MPVAARLALALVVLFAGEAAAQCRVHATGLNFGIHRALSVSTSTGTITVDCKSGIPFHIELSEGAGTFATRRLRGHRGGSLEYNLYTRPNYSRVWGDGIAAGTHTVGGIMPPTGMLPQATIDEIRQWITDGAQR